MNPRRQRKMLEDQPREPVELFLDIKPEELLGRKLSDQELRKLGS
jgi:hypothetical protein